MNRRRGIFFLLFLLTLTYAIGAQALTVTSEQIEHPIFPWGAYTLRVDLYTDDPEQVADQNAPTDGLSVMLRIASVSGQIALTDIQEKSDVFVLRGADGVNYSMSAWRVRGVRYVNDQFVTDEGQDGFELIYHLPSGVMAGGATLVVDPEAKERIIVRLPESGEAPAETPEITPKIAPSNTPTPSWKFIDAILAGEAEKATDPWVLAILEQGSWDSQCVDDKFTFSLRTMNPKLDALGDYERGKADYLTRLYRNIWEKDLEYTLPTEFKDGVYGATDADVGTLMKAVTSAAAKTRAAFDDKRMRVAIAEYMLNADTIYSDFNRDLEIAAYAPLIEAQVKQSLNVSGGPGALVLQCTGVDGVKLAQAGYEAALSRLSKKAYANQMEYGEIESVFREELMAQAAVLKKKSAETFAFTFDIDQLLDGSHNPGEAFSSYLDAYETAYGEMMSQLNERVSEMPDMLAQDFPKSGLITGKSSGTLVNLRIPNDGMARYVQMRKAETDEAVAGVFIRPGGKASVRVPKGEYYILVAIGDTWYGAEQLFGANGQYTRTEDLTIKSSNYYHTITLGGAVDGNMSSYGADLSDFQ